MEKALSEILAPLLHRFQKALALGESAAPHGAMIGVFQGHAVIADDGWCALQYDRNFSEVLTLDRKLKIVEQIYPAHNLPSRSELQKGKKIDAPRLKKLLSALGPDIPSDVLLSFHFDARGIGMPVLCCDAAGSEAVFNPKLLLKALSAFGLDLLDEEVASYLPGSGMLVIRNSAFSANRVVLLMGLE